MQHPEPPRNAEASAGKGKRNARHRAGGYQKVFDGRKRAVRGLWVRNGRYYARLAIPHPGTGVKQVRRVPLESATTDAAAQAALRRLLTERADDALPVVGQAPKFRDYVAQYFAHYAKAKDKKRPGTLETERAHLNAWMKRIGEVRLHQINRAMVNKFIEDRLDEGASPRTVNLGIICLRNVLKRAVDDNWIKILPTLNLKPLKVESRERRLYTAQDILLVCAHAQQECRNGKQFADFVRLLMYAGSRMAETLRLKWSDVHWEQRQLTIGSDGQSKNRKSRRVDFNPQLETLLREMHSCRAADSEWMFPATRNATPEDLPAKSLRETLLVARSKAELPQFGFHDCRHFFISQCVMTGIDYMTIARWVGHQDGGVLIGRVYGHVNDMHAQKQASRISFF